MNRTSQTSSGAKSAWPGHLLLAFMACAWLVATKYYIDVPFIAIVGGIALLMLCDGAVNSHHTRQLVKCHQVEVQGLKQEVENKALELTQLVKMSPALRKIFTMLHPKEAFCDSSNHYFAEWLTWALNEPTTNLMEWMTAYRKGYSRGLPPLEGLFNHLNPALTAKERQEIKNAVAAQAEGELSMMYLRERPVRATAEPQSTQPQASVPAKTTAKKKVQRQRTTSGKTLVSAAS